jgi:hypothetical protein
MEGGFWFYVDVEKANRLWIYENMVDSTDGGSARVLPGADLDANAKALASERVATQDLPRH